MGLKGPEVTLGGGGSIISQAEGWDIYSWKEEGEAEETIKLGSEFVGQAIGPRPSWKIPPTLGCSFAVSLPRGKPWAASLGRACPCNWGGGEDQCLSHLPFIAFLTSPDR